MHTRDCGAHRDAPPARLTEVNDWSEVPAFATECEEADFWGAHSLGPTLLEQMVTCDDPALPPLRRRPR